jgi:hypothetical protein
LLEYTQAHIVNAVALSEHEAMRFIPPSFLENADKPVIRGLGSAIQAVEHLVITRRPYSIKACA